MDFSANNFLAVVILCVQLFCSNNALDMSVFPQSNDRTGNNYMKVIHLDLITSQGFINLPYPYLDWKSEDYTCHYFVSFLYPLSSDSYQHDFGISVVARNVSFRDYGELQLETRPHDPSKKPINVTWNKKYFSEEKDNFHSSSRKEFSESNADICINLNGNWTRSTASLLLTFYFNTSDYDYPCPEGMSRCFRCLGDDDPSSSSEEYELSIPRCISNEIFCNGVPNCPCGGDEGVVSCPSNVKNYNDGAGACMWTNIEYLLMMVMTGFLLILIPVVFLLTMMYHRRMSALRGINGNRVGHSGPYDDNNNAERQYPHAITTAPAYDPPPNYDDLPEDLKTPSSGGEHQEQRQ